MSTRMSRKLSTQYEGKNSAGGNTPKTFSASDTKDVINEATPSFTGSDLADNADTMTKEGHVSAVTPKSKRKTYKEKYDDSAYECNICLDISKDPVVSMCGHLFCWPCLEKWLKTRPTRKICPVCKAYVRKDKVIPLYGLDSTEEDPRNKVLPNSVGRRSKPVRTNGFTRFRFGNVLNRKFEIAYVCGEIHTLVDQREQEDANEGQQNSDRIFSCVPLILCIAWLLFA